MHMRNVNNGENLQLLQFDVGDGPETRQQTTWSGHIYVHNTSIYIHHEAVGSSMALYTPILIPYECVLLWVETLEDLTTSLAAMI